MVKSSIQKKFFVFVMAAICCNISAQVQPDQFKTPNERLRYDQAAFVTSHNSFTASESGWNLPQQTWSIKTQLEKGIRGFMLDLHEHEGVAKLCHGDRGVACVGLYALQKSGPFETLQEVLQAMNTWLNQNPTEIITLMLENYVSADLLKKPIEAVAGFAAKVLRPSDWDPEQRDGQWPTLKWMRDQNKRVLIFNNLKNPQDGYSYYMWRWWIETNFGELGFDKACEQRASSNAQDFHKDRRLLVIDYFTDIGKILSGEAKFAPEVDNAYFNLKDLVAHCKTKGLAGGKRPNSLGLDFVNQGNAMKLINELNEEAARQLPSE